MQSRDSTSSRQYVVRLSKLLDEKFNLQELKEICFNLNLDFENIPGDIKAEKAQGLAGYFERRHNLSQLVLAIKEARPDIIIDLPPNEAQVSQKTHARRLYLAAISSMPTDKPADVFFHLPWLSALLGSTNVATPSGLAKFVEEEDAAGKTTLAVLTHQLNEKDLILKSFDDLGCLLRGGVGLLQEANSQGGNLRMGIYSEVVYVDADSREVPVISDESVNVARRIMALGEAGHVLATGAVVDSLKDCREFESCQVQSIGKSEIKYHVRVDVYNLFNDRFGNSAKPSLIAPLQVLERVLIPKELRCAKPKKLELTFSPNVGYTKVLFKFKNPDLQISMLDGEVKDNTYEYLSSNGGPYERTFDVWAIKAETDSLEPVEIYCQDEAGDLVAPPVRGRIMLRRRAPPPDGPTQVIKLGLWVWDRLVCFPWYGKVVFPILVVSAASLVIFLRFNEAQRTHFVEQLLIDTHIWPAHYSGEWHEPFLITADGRPDRHQWKNPPPAWYLAAGEGSDTNDQALLTAGEQIGVTDLHGFSLYDFKVDIRIHLLADQHDASWILRAKDSGSYYLFTLIFPPADGTPATIRGTIYKRGVEVARLTSTRAEVGYYHAFHENDVLFVTILADGYSFKHTFNYDCANTNQNATEDDSDDLTPCPNFDAGEIGLTLEDKNKYYRYGDLGFRNSSPASKMRIESVDVVNAR